MKGRLIDPLSIVLATVLLAGCAKWNGMVDYFKDDAVAVESLSEAGGPVEPQTTEPIAIKEVWDSSIAGSPDEHRQHPGGIVVTETDLYVGSYQGDVIRVNREDGDVVWQSSAGDSVVGGVAVDETRVFAGTRNGEMLAFAREDGEELWRVSVSTSVASAPLVAGDTVLFVTLDNRTYALDSKDGTRLWVHSTTPEALVVMGASPPTVNRNMVYVGYATGEVFALSLAEGTPKWKEDLSVLGGRGELDMLQDVDAGIVVPTDTRLSASALNKLFTVNHRGRAVALYAPSGTKLWEQSISAIRRPLLVKQRLFLADMEGNVVALGTDDGIGLWRTHLSSGLLTAPVRMGENIVVADSQGKLFALDMISGRLLGVESLDQAQLADPVVMDNSLFLWGKKGDLIRYDF